MDAVGSTKGPRYDCLLFDLDDTLYPLSSGLNLACRKNIQEFMLQKLAIDESDVPRMCLDLYKEHGTTMAGLKALGYEFNNDEFHACVHGTLPYNKLKPDPVLRNLLLSMPQRKIVKFRTFGLLDLVTNFMLAYLFGVVCFQIFTNADKAHAAEALKRLGLEDCFEGIICFETLNPSAGTTATTRILCKPSVEAIEAAIRIADVDPSKTIFFDDSTRNIASGKLAGLRTVIVGSSVLVQGADYALNSIHNIREAIPEIWEYEVEQQAIIQSTAVETLVHA